MVVSGHDEVRNYGFADKALALRKRARLTQPELGALLGVSKRTICAWESGVAYPAAERLQQLIALYLARGALAAGREEEEAAALWEAARQRAGRHLAPFDPHWFVSLHGQRSATVATAPPSPVQNAGRMEQHDGRETLAAAVPRHDWGEVPAAADERQ